MGLKIPRLGEIKGIVSEVLPVVAGALAAFGLSQYVIADLSFGSGIFNILVIWIILVGYWLLTRLILKSIIEIRHGAHKEKSEHISSREDNFSGLVRATAPYNRVFGKRIFIITAVVCFICYLPYFLYEFPGIMTADSMVQLDQATGQDLLTNHHPVIHTFIIGIFYKLGLLVTGNRPTFAIAFYTFFQMIFMCLCCGAAVKETLRIVKKRSYRFAFALMFFYALIPFNPVFAVTIWKDVPFAGIAMLLCIVITEILRKGEKSKVSDFVKFTILSILFCLFRSNAWYAYLIFAVAFVISMRRIRLKQALISVITCVVIVLIIKIPVFNALNIPGPDFTESLSVPLQQVARVLVNDRAVAEEDLAMIDEVIDRTYIHELYAPGFADNIKELVRAGHPEVLENNKAGYLGLWLRLGCQYPGDYLDAWFDLNGGYIYPNVEYKVADADGVMDNIHGIIWNPLFGGKFIKVKEILIKLSDFMPIYGMLFSAGIYTWALVFSIVRAIRRKKSILIQTLMLLLILTLLIAAPLVTFRYAYAVVMTWPLWLFGAKRI